MKNQYTWEYSLNEEIWRHDLFDTVEDCVKDYLENYSEEYPRESIFVGEAIPYKICVDGSSVIDAVQENAWENCGDVSEGWQPSAIKGLENWNELDEQLTEVVEKWLKKHNEMPSFYSVTSIREVSVI